AAAVAQGASFLPQAADRMGAGVWLASARRRLYLAPSVIQMVEMVGSYGDLVAASIREEAKEAFVTEVRGRSPHVPYPVALDYEWRALLKTSTVLPWVHLPDTAPQWNELLKSPSALRTGLESSLPTARHEHVRMATEMVLVRRNRDGTEVLLVQRDPDLLGILRVSKVGIGEPDSVLFNRVDGVSPERRALSKVPVAIVGAGSLGSAIALALARAGVADLLLIDHDVLELDNICRHVGIVTEVGDWKVKVVERAILGVNPAARVECMKKPLAWDMPDYGAGLDFERWLEGHRGAIVVSTCAFGPVERQLNEVLVGRGIPAIYASVLGAGHHGRIHRVIPGQTACYECVLIAQNAEPKRFPRYVVDGVDQESRVPYLQPSLPGLAIDIAQVALVAARMALQTIARTRGIDLGLADEVGDHLLWTNRGGWAFDDRPLSVRVERPPRDEGCEACGKGGAHEELSDAERAELSDLLGRIRRPRDGTPGEGGGR
ncbi:MAG: ThiF family adenylyltransferase, partial [Nannocystaceae bacterium]